MEEQGDTGGGHPGVPSVAGRWQLLAWRSVDDAGAVTGRPFGEHPHGVLIYTPGGWMAGQLAAASRPAMEGADPLGGPQDQRAAAYSTYVAYWGRYAVAGDRIIGQRAELAADRILVNAASWARQLQSRCGYPGRPSASMVEVTQPKGTGHERPSRA